MTADLAAIINRSATLSIFEQGEESLAARLALIHEAQRAIDLQYYAINNDVTANLLIEAMVRAARRGVTVRFLIDDVSLGRMYKSLSALNLHDGIAVKVFNPVSRDDQTMVSRLLAFIEHLPRATRRMHNKALIVDGDRAIVGGRNLGDEYFDSTAQAPFRDLDLLARGEVVADILDSFERFWASPHAVPITELYSRKIGRLYRFAFERRLRRNWRKMVRRHGREKLEPRLADLTGGDHDIDAVSGFVSDPPEKIEGDVARDALHPIELLGRLVDAARSEVLIVSPYFVPGDDGLAALQGLKARGVAVRVITNSLASTDVVAVHTGYRKYREALLAAGVELWEMKPTGRRQPRQRPLGKGSPSYASLHAKTYVVDRRYSLTGSLNLDPRSIALNTETALAVDNMRVGETLGRIFDETTDPDHAYRVSLKDGALRWTTRDKNRMRVYRREPRAGVWRRVQEFLIRFLPVEDQL